MYKYIKYYNMGYLNGLKDFWHDKKINEIKKLKKINDIDIKSKLYDIGYINAYSKNKLLFNKKI